MEGPNANQPLRAFISYASEDDAHRIQLQKHLRLLQRQGVLETWHDRKILPGGRWGQEIDQQLEHAELILCLLSVDFITSDYCWDIEMKRALERHEAGRARVIPIIVDECDWQSSPLGQLQALPERAKPVTTWPNPAGAWTSVAKGIRQTAQQTAPSRATEVNPPESPPSPERYLEALKEENAYVEIRGMGAQVSERMPLRQVYMRLQASAPGRELGREIGGHPKTGDAPERLAADHHRELRDLLPEHPHAALVGDPGSGKTTFQRYVAQNLARALLGDSDALSRIGLLGEPPFPVFVRLERLAHFLTENPDPSYEEDAPEHFYRYLDHALAGRPYGLSLDYLRSRVLEGGCFLLLDGLDEVPGAQLRERMVALIGQVIIQGKRVGNRHLITCRTRAYQGRVQLAGDIATFRLAPLGAAQVEQFCEGWSRALYRVGANETGTPAAEQALRYRDELLRAIEANPSRATFSQSPLMLTVLAVVHWNKKKLPEQRAELYDNAVEYLLESRSSLSQHPTPLRRECLQAVAIAMFEDSEGVQRSLGRLEAAKAVRPLLGVARDPAIEFLENEALYSGLLVSRSEGEVEFWHLTFQEYLAALELSQDEGWWKRIAPYLTDDRWSEVILLLAGCRRRQGGVRAAKRMLEQILDTASDRVSQARAVGLVGRILRDIKPYGGDPAAGTQWETMLAQTLAIFEPGGETVDEPTRVEVGDALGQAGDPRLEDETGNRVLIRGGSFWMGAQSTDSSGPGYDSDAEDREAPVHRARVSDFVVGRYPVTVQDYRRFVDAREEGYLNPRCWDPRGWAWREDHTRESPDDWQAQLGHPNRPVTGVSWYEGDAYCRWVGGRLPTEAEWEWLVRGAEGRKYPWGKDAPTEDHANFAMRLGQPTPVGIYPGDHTDTGVRDLAGNVLEWCADWFGDYSEEAVENPQGPEEGEWRVLRGGSFFGDAEDLRGACRYGSPPVFDDDSVGFRVVWSPSGGQD